MPVLYDKKGKVKKRYPYTPAGEKAYTKAKDAQDGADKVRYPTVVPPKTGKRY